MLVEIFFSYDTKEIFIALSYSFTLLILKFNPSLHKLCEPKINNH